MTGKGISRIDGVFANATAAAAVVGVRYRWDLTAIDHVPIEARLHAHDHVAAGEVIKSLADVLRDHMVQLS